MSIWRQHLGVQLILSTPSSANELVRDLSADNTVRTAIRDHFVAATLALVDDSAVYLGVENDHDEPVLFIVYLPRGPISPPKVLARGSFFSAGEPVSWSIVAVVDTE